MIACVLKEVEVEVELCDIDTEDLMEELGERGKHLSIGKDEKVKDPLRHGVEDRDWRKIEEALELADIYFSRLTPERQLTLIKVAA